MTFGLLKLEMQQTDCNTLANRSLTDLDPGNTCWQVYKQWHETTKVSYHSQSSSLLLSLKAICSFIQNKHNVTLASFRLINYVAKCREEIINTEAENVIFPDQEKNCCVVLTQKLVKNSCKCYDEYQALRKSNMSCWQALYQTNVGHHPLTIVFFCLVNF